MIKWKIEDLYSKIFDSTVVAIGITDMNGRYLAVNNAWCKLLGYTSEEAKKMCVNDVTPPEDIDSSTTNMYRLITGEMPGIRLNRRYMRKDGLYFWADLHVSPITNNEHQIVGLVGIFVDIDRQVKAEENLQQLNNQLINANTELQRAMEDLSKLARIDPLTQLYNRRVLNEILENELQRSIRNKRGFAVAMGDLDNFKRINDSYGHEVGDLALIEMAKILRKEIRTTDFVGRWGGEEFLFIFTETTCQGALIVIERIRQTVENVQIPVKDIKIGFTVSIGLSYHSGGEGGNAIVEEADKALYRAKVSGKNRCEFFQNNC